LGEGWSVQQNVPSNIKVNNVDEDMLFVRFCHKRGVVLDPSFVEVRVIRDLTFEVYVAGVHVEEATLFKREQKECYFTSWFDFFSVLEILTSYIKFDNKACTGLEDAFKEDDLDGMDLAEYVENYIKNSSESSRNVLLMVVEGVPRHLSCLGLSDQKRASCCSKCSVGKTLRGWASRNLA